MNVSLLCSSWWIMTQFQSSKRYNVWRSIVLATRFILFLEWDFFYSLVYIILVCFFYLLVYIILVCFFIYVYILFLYTSFTGVMLWIEWKNEDKVKIISLFYYKNIPLLLIQYTIQQYLPANMIRQIGNESL